MNPCESVRVTAATAQPPRSAGAVAEEAGGGSSSSLFLRLLHLHLFCRGAPGPEPEISLWFQPLQLGSSAYTTVPQGGMRRCHGMKNQTKELFGNNCAVLARLARALLRVQTCLGGPADGGYRCLTGGCRSGKQRELHLRQALPELSPRAHASSVAWPPHTADICV